MYVMITTFFVFALLERVFTGYPWPKQPLWIARGLAWLAMVVLFNHFTSSTIDMIVPQYSFIDFSGMGLWALVPGILIYEVALYGYHRALHDVPYLWRLHQTHHSSERLDIWSAYHIHPVELLGWSFVGAFVFRGLLGTTIETAFWFGIFITTIQTIQHANIRTPKWLGYLIARPENHMLHHARGKHRANYADLPIIDMLFGTFALPESAPKEVGFWDGASQRFVEQMLGKDVTKPTNPIQR